MATSAKSTSENSKRLWIGNLDKRLTEYNLLKIIQHYGDVENFEFLFHTMGPNKGEPRTFCFVEYKREEDAEHALRNLNGKIVLSQPLRVRWATESMNNKDTGLPKNYNSTQNKVVDVLSRDDKIKAIEEKLKLMENSGEEKMKPAVFHGKHPLLARSCQQNEKTRNTRQKLRQPYPSFKKRS